MTLQQWVERYGISPTSPTTETGAVSVIVQNNYPAVKTLYRLDDYVVSSRTGVVFWLTPRSKESK